MNIRDMIPFRKHRIGRYSGFGFHSIPEIEDRMTDLMENFFSNLPAISGTAQSMIMPLLNMSENDKGILIKVELPGLKEEDVQIESRNNQIIIKGEKKEEKEEKDSNYHIRESSYGKFMRTVSLPFDVDIDKTTAVFKNGMLEISAEKPQGTLSESKTIPIKKSK